MKQSITVREFEVAFEKIKYGGWGNSFANLKELAKEVGMHKKILLERLRKKASGSYYFFKSSKYVYHKCKNGALQRFKK